MSDLKKPVIFPSIKLKGENIPLGVLSYIPLNLAQKYQLLAFDLTEKELKLAICHPERLKKDFFVSLSNISKKIGRRVVIYTVSEEDYKEQLKKYEDQLMAPASSPKVKVEFYTESEPPIFKLGKAVAYKYLKKIPLNFAKEHRIVCVDFSAPNIYWFLSDGTHKEGLAQIVPYLESKNKIEVRLLKVMSGDLDDLLDYYIEKSKTQATRPEEETKKEDVLLDMGDEEKLAEGVVVPDVQAKILDVEEAKTGVAGYFQKVSQSFTTSDPLDEKKPEAEAESEPIALVTPEAPEEKKEEEPQKAVLVPKAPEPDKDQGIISVKTHALDNENGSDIGNLLDNPVLSLEELISLIKKGFVPLIVAAIVSYAIHEKASDIHVEVYEDEIKVRYRIDGQLVDIIKLPPDIQAAIVSRIKILAHLRLDETRVPQDGRFDVIFKDRQVDLRVSVMPTIHGEKVVMRILEKNKQAASMSELGLGGPAYQNLMKAINKPYGICLATGPTGSGKSTSLYAILSLIATSNVNVITLEDPIEYEMKGVNQSQIRPKIGFSFAEGLRSVLRQDPNVIMVGEIRDNETANMATQAALTGHLVLSTLHTNDAAGTIPRLNNMGVEPFLITSSLSVIIGQRLVRKICQHCKTEVSIPQGVKDNIIKDIEHIKEVSPGDASRFKPPYTFYQGTGCDQCNGKGYSGRIGIYEVMVMSDKIEELTIARAGASAIQEQAQKEGMITMYQDGLIKVANGITTLDEVLRETSNK